MNSLQSTWEGCDIRRQEEGETYLPIADDFGRAEPGAQQKAQVVFFRNFGITTSHNGVVLRRFSILLCETSENLCQPSAGVAEVVMPSCWGEVREGYACEFGWGRGEAQAENMSVLEASYVYLCPRMTVFAACIEL